MALALFDRVQETSTTAGTGSIVLAGAVSGFQSFAVVGNGNTCYYTIVDGSAWEVGVGTYSTSGPTLARTTILSNSNGNVSPITLTANSKSVFLTYPAGKSVNLNESGNVSPLGTVVSGIWNGTTIGVAYGGTGVTASSGANSVVLRDSNQNITVNRINQGIQTITASGGTTVLTAASQFNQALVGTGGQTYRLPDATTLTDTTTFQFNNNATGTLTIQNNAGTTVGSIASGGAAGIALLSNATVGGTWDVHAYIPESVTWGTNALTLGSTVITGGTWQGGTIATGYGGTGLTSYTSGGAVYANSSSTLTSGTLPITAGGTGATTAAGAQSSLNVPSTTGSGASGTWGISITGSASGSSGSVVNAATFNSSGAGDASGTTFNGSAARTISYNTIGAPSTTGANASGAWNISSVGISIPTQQTEYTILDGPANGPVIKVRYDGATANRYIDIGSKDGYGTFYSGLKVYNGDTLTMNGNTVLSAANYNSYAPTLTGGGASGTWGINVTGTAGSISGFNNPTTAATANTIAYRDSGGDIYQRYSFAVHFNQSSSNTENPSIAAFWTNSGADNYNRKSSPAHVISQLGLITTSNYNSYAPTLTGGGASGTWGINITGNASGSSTSVSATTATGIQSSYSTTINTTTPGLANYGFAFVGHGTSDYAQGITWAWTGTNAQAGIYVQSSGSYGTKMYFGTTDSFATGSKTSMSIDHVGVVQIPRNYLQSDSSLRAPIFYDSNNTAYYVDPTASTSAVFLGSVDARTYNYAGLLVNASGTGSAGAAFGIQQVTAEGWTGVFVDYEPNTGWGLYHDNPNNFFCVTAESSAGNFRSFTVPSRSSGNRTAYEKIRFDQNNGDIISGNISYAYGSSRAPFFYDYDNTAYLINAAGYSYLFDLEITGAGNKYLYINPGNGYEAMVRYNGGTGSTWYVGKRMSNDLVDTDSFHFYSQAAGLTVGGIGATGNMFAKASLRTPIFYDLDNTGYYVDPASTSNLYTGIFNSGATFFNDGSSRAMYIRGSGNIIQFCDTDGTFRWENVGRNGEYYVYKGYGTGAGYKWQINNSGDHIFNGVVSINTDIRAPIFYDINNTGFYTDPASTSYINGLSVAAQTWRDTITWNNSVNINVNGESSFDVYGGTWQVWDTGNGAPMLTCPYQGQVTIGNAGSRGLYVYGSITASGNVTAYSDERVKTNWRGYGVDFVQRLAEVKHGTYDRTDQELTQDGVSAQSLQKLLPHSVMGDESLSVAYGNAALVSSVELAKYVTALEQRISQLEARL